MNAKQIESLARNYAATILFEGAAHWAEPDELYDSDDPEQNERQVEQWRNAMRKVANELRNKVRRNDQPAT